MNSQSFGEYATEAMRYWEPRRIAYNLLLAAVVLFYFFAAWPGSKTQVHMDTALNLFLLAVLANVAYCAAYLVDIVVQASAFREHWRSFRWLLFALGLSFAAVLTRLFVVGMFLPKAID